MDPTIPDVQVVPPVPHAPRKLPFNLKVVLPIVAMVVALPFIARSVLQRQLTGSRAALPNTYCVETFGCPTPTPTPQTTQEVCPESLNIGLVNRDSYYGYVKINGVPAPLGTAIKLYSPRGELVGCGSVSLNNGGYPFTNAWGSEPNLFNGMNYGEPVKFMVNNQAATTSIPRVIWQGKLLTTQVDLTVGTAPSPYPTPTPTPLPTTPTPGKIGSGPTPPPGCYYQPVRCIRAPCDPLLVCPTPILSASPIPTPVALRRSVVNVMASGSGVNNVFPTMVLEINGTRVASWSNVRGNPLLRIFQAYTYAHTTTIKPTDIVRVRFTNDAYQSPLADRNLFVDKIVIDGKTYQSEASTTYSAGVWKSSNGCAAGFKSSEKLSCNGYLQYKLN